MLAATLLLLQTSPVPDGPLGPRGEAGSASGPADAASCEGACVDEVVNQPPTANNGFFSDAGCDACGGAQVLAENLVLEDEFELCQLVVHGGYFPDNVPTADSFTVLVHGDGGVEPGPVLYSESQVPSTSYPTGDVLFGVDRWRTILTLSSPVALTPGVYWVQVFNDTGFGGDDWFWEAGSLSAGGAPFSAFSDEAPGVDWTPSDMDMSLLVCGRDLTPTPTNTCIQAPPGIVGWWPAEGDAGDLWGEADGDLVGTATATQGRVGRAFSFDADGDGVTVPWDDAWTESGELTVELWVRASSVQDGVDAAGTYTVVDAGHDPLDPGGWFLEGHAPTEQVTFVVVVEGQDPDRTKASCSLPLDDGWHHLAGTFDGESVVVYLDGQEGGRADGFPGQLVPGTGAMDVGFDGVRQERFLRGAVDELALYRRALEPAEVAALWDSGSRGKSRLRGPYTVRPAGMVAWWPFEGGAGELVQGQDGIVTGGAGFGDWCVGRAVVLDEDGDGVEVPHDPAVDPTEAFTVELWMRAAEVQDGSTEGRFLVVDKSHGAPDDSGWYVEGLEATGEVLFGAHLTTGEVSVALPSLTDGVWHHLAGTYDGAALRAYLDGVPTAEMPASGSVVSNTRPLRVGSWHLDGGRNFRGAVDELALYDRALRPEEVAALHAVGRAGKLRADTCGPAAATPDGILRILGRHGWIQRPSTGRWYRLTDTRTFGLSDGKGPTFAPDWNAAEQEARLLGGHLVAIDDAAENAWLVQTFSAHEELWIGLTDAAAEGVWTWSDGSPLVYTNWAVDMPDQIELDEDAASINQLRHFEGAGLWDDLGNDPASYPGRRLPLRGIVEAAEPPWM